MHACRECFSAGRLAARLALLVMLMPGPPADAASAAPAPALGAHVLLVQTEGKGTSPAVSQPLTTQASGSSLLALVSSYASNPDGPTDSYANHWTPLGGSVVYRNYEGRFDARAYVALSVKGGPGHTISVVKPGRPAGEISVPFIEITGANQLQDVARNYPGLSLAERALNKFKRGWRKLTGVALGTSTVLTSGAVTTTGPATLVAVWWGDGRVLKMTATPGDGFKLIDSFLDLPPNSGVQCAVAVKQVAVAGTYKVSWSGTPAQGAILWLFAFQHQAR